MAKQGNGGGGCRRRGRWGWGLLWPNPETVASSHRLSQKWTVAVRAKTVPVKIREGVFDLLHACVNLWNLQEVVSYHAIYKLWI